LFVSPLRAEESKPIRLIIHARAIETPVLKYRLFPSEAELKRGNAVPILLRLPWEQMPWMNTVFPTLKEWESRPLGAPEWAKSNGVLPDSFFSEMRRAAYRREATWEYPIGETPSLYFILLPDVAGLRDFLGRGLAARIRYHISRGELDEAREGILVGLANARHLAQAPFYVNQLVAITIDRAMLERTAELVSRPDSPNLYWALSTLPDSLVELGRTASFEGDLFALTFPAVSDLDRPREVAEWTTMAGQLIALLEETEELPKSTQQAEDAAARSIPRQWVKVARDELPQLLHTSAEKVTAMSDEEAAIRWYVHERLAADQRASAIVRLPPGEAWPLLARLRDDVRAMHDKAGTKGSGFFDPTSVYLSIWSLKRKIESLRIIEAIRHHMATHDGKLPARLDDIKEVSVPVDSLTGEPFEWQAEGSSAILKAPPLPAVAFEPDSSTARANMLEYWLRTSGGDQD
jgi:hypothetical protein